MVIHAGSIWLFGGSNGKVTLNDFWRFDFKDKKWSRIESLNGPEVEYMINRVVEGIRC